MIVSACSILFLAVVNMLFNHRNKFNYIFLLYIISISLLMMVSTVYIYKLTSYSFASLYDFRLYQLINRLKLSITEISRLQNICNALFMFSALISVYLFKKLKPGYFIALFIPILYFIIVNDPSFTWHMYLVINRSENAVIIERFIEFNSNLSVFLFFLYSILPLSLLAIRFFATKIRVRKNDCAVFFTCLFLLDLFVYIIFFAGSFKAIMFNQVDLLKFPFISLNGITESTFMPYSIIFIVLTIFTLTIIYKPFKEWRFITHREMMNNTQLMSQNLKMILHTYKNAFLGVERLTNLANEYVIAQNTEKVMACTTQLNQIATENMATISHAIEMLKNVNIKHISFKIVDCIDEAVLSACLSPDITLIMDYDRKSAERIEAYGDFNYLKEAFVNLFTNADYALKETPDPVIRVKIISETDICSVEIQDNGCGIDKKQIRNIFKSFYTTKTNSSSFGIGLNYVQTIVEQHHGSVSVKSKVGQYTSFQVVLPRSKNFRSIKETLYDQLGNLRRCRIFNQKL